MRNKFFTIISLGLLLACGGEDDDSTTETDAGVDVSDDTGPEDAGSEEDTETSEEVCDEEQAIRDAIGLVDAVSDGEVIVVEEADGITTLTIDASAGGSEEEQVNNPYLYFDFETNSRLDITDIEALENTEWDLAFKRAAFRINGGDSGPHGGMLVLENETTWEDATKPVQGETEFIQDEFVDGETCEVFTVARGQISTAFGVWFLGGPNGLSPIETIYTHYASEPSHTLRKIQLLSWEDGVLQFRYMEWP